MLRGQSDGPKERSMWSGTEAFCQHSCINDPSWKHLPAPVEPQKRAAPTNVLTVISWKVMSQTTQLHHYWIPDLEKLWGYKYLLFKEIKFGGNLLCSSRDLRQYPLPQPWKNKTVFTWWTVTWEVELYNAKSTELWAKLSRFKSQLLPAVCSWGSCYTSQL